MKDLISIAVTFKNRTVLCLILISLIALYFDYKWLLVFWSLIGVVINIYKYKLCFVIWIITNASWAVIDFCKGLPEQGVLFSIYFSLALHGLYVWHKESKEGC